VNSINTK